MTPPSPEGPAVSEATVPPGPAELAEDEGLSTSLARLGWLRLRHKSIVRRFYGGALLLVLLLALDKSYGGILYLLGTAFAGRIGIALWHSAEYRDVAFSAYMSSPSTTAWRPSARCWTHWSWTTNRCGASRSKR